MFIIRFIYFQTIAARITNAFIYLLSFDSQENNTCTHEIRTIKKTVCLLPKTTVLTTLQPFTFTSCGNSTARWSTAINRFLHILFKFTPRGPCTRCNRSIQQIHQLLLLSIFCTFIFFFRSTSVNCCAKC